MCAGCKRGRHAWGERDEQGGRSCLICGLRRITRRKRLPGSGGSSFAKSYDGGATYGKPAPPCLSSERPLSMMPVRGGDCG